MRTGRFSPVVFAQAFAHRGFVDVLRIPQHAAFHAASDREHFPRDMPRYRRRRQSRDHARNVDGARELAQRHAARDALNRSGLLKFRTHHVRRGPARLHHVHARERIEQYDFIFQ